MIIWLASYPKSGNTWVRAFISSLLYSENGINDFTKLSKIPQFPDRRQFKTLIDNFQDYKIVSANWKSAQNLLTLDNDIKFLKTHHALVKINNFEFTDNTNSLGVIHIVRDPRTVLLSLKNHFGVTDSEEAKNFLFNEHLWLGINKKEEFKDRSNKIPTLIGSWRINYLSWKNKIQNYLLVKYEDLLEDPYKEFFRISNYLENLMKCKFDKDKINNAIKSTSFEKLQNLEEKGYFNEHGQGVKFFNSGPNSNWKLELDEKIVQELNIRFKNEMLELGYL